MIEHWKIGMMGLTEKKKLKILLAPYTPLFHYSTTPLFQWVK
jgi:hypothetical protein